MKQGNSRQAKLFPGVIRPVTAWQRGRPKAVRSTGDRTLPAPRPQSGHSRRYEQDHPGKHGGGFRHRRYQGVTVRLRHQTLLSSVTAPFSASNRPSIVAPVSAVMEVKARMFPLKSVYVPRVAELPTSQNTWQACAPPIRLTLLLDAVMKVDPAWIIQTALGLPWPSRVRVPDRKSELLSL